jgi:hypothetical protein
MKQIYTPDLYVLLRHGGTLDLPVCREDKVELIRSVVRSFDNHSDFKHQVLNLCDAIDTNGSLPGRSQSSKSPFSWIGK